MNIILNTPLPTTFVSKREHQEYDNKILFVFLIFMIFLATLGLLFVNVSRELSKTSPVQLTQF